MNNKRGGFFGKLILVLILMIASAIGGAYGYYILDGKMAVNEATKIIETVNSSDYDSEDSTRILKYISSATSELETAKGRKAVYEILSDFNSKVSEVSTAAEKELAEAKAEAEQAKKEAEEARNSDTGEYGYGYDENEDTGSKSGSIVSGQKTEDNDSGVFKRVTKAIGLDD